MTASEPARAAPRASVPALVAGAWFLVLAAGMGVLWRYKSTPGPRTAESQRWPEGTSLRADGERPTLVLFAHPCCPCTRASLGELRGFLPRFEGRVNVLVASYRPVAPPPEWDESDLLSASSSMPQAELVFDLEGREATRFGVATSGHVLLYGAGGELLYSGGITLARGHRGDNAGLQGLGRALEAELAGRPPATVDEVPVFGCPIHASAADSAAKP